VRASAYSGRGGAVDLSADQVRELAELAPSQGYDVTGLARQIVRAWLEAQRSVATSGSEPR
jgi:hypothetical protein